jgi:hypothetical protein
VPEAFDMVWRLCAPGSAAAGELNDLFEDAMGIELPAEDGQVVLEKDTTRCHEKPRGTLWA